MFWGPERLHERLSEGRVTPYSIDRLDGASYRLSIGREVYVTPPTGKTRRKSKSIFQLKDDEPIVIPAGQFAFLITEESVKVELNEIAFISIRAKIKYQGLVNVSGFHVDPGFEGHLIFAVFNAGPTPVYLRQGQDIFLIWFSDLSDSIASPRPPNSATIPTELVKGISGKFYSLAGLADELDKLKNKFLLQRTILWILLSVILAFGAIFIKSVGTQAFNCEVSGLVSEFCAITKLKEKSETQSN